MKRWARGGSRINDDRRAWNSGVSSSSVPGSVGEFGGLGVVPRDPKETLGTAGGTLGELGMVPKEPKVTLGTIGGALDGICEDDSPARVCQALV